MRKLLIEGVNGCGKSTIIRMIRHKLITMNWRTEILVDGGTTSFGTKVGNMVASTPLTTETQLFLYLAARSELTRTHIPSLEKDCKYVLLDRFSPSTFVYQGDKIDYDKIKSMDEFARNSVVPDITFLLVSKPENYFKRIEQRDNVILNELQKAELIKLEDSYFKVLSYLNWNYVVVENNKEPDKAAQQIFDYIVENYENIQLKV